MIRITQLKLPLSHTGEDLENAVKKALRPGSAPFSFQIRRQSLDAREKENLKYVYTVDVTVRKEKKILRQNRNPDISAVTEQRYHFPKSGDQKLSHRPVIIGSGPAGLFCGWYLANAGYRPVILERGEAVTERQKKVERFWKEGILDTESNVQFGEGGAGTFSDGKLNTLVKDPAGRNHEVLKRFVRAGAPEEILYQQKPHLGTDMLTGIVRNLRSQIISMGGEVRFRQKVTDIQVQNGALSALVINGEEILPAEVCVLAIGHSARDTFEMLLSHGIAMEPKAFAIGVRSMHPQQMINRELYGKEEIPGLGSASYKLTHKSSGGRGVYSFCMCPGGYIVNASSEQGRTAINGMSYQDRASGYANSAIVVTVAPGDFEGEGPLSGIAFQRKLEEAAFREGKGGIPVQRFRDFENNLPGEEEDAPVPCIKGAYRYANVRNCLPAFAADAIVEGIHAFAGAIKGFDMSDTWICGVESRTSSPVRILRNAALHSSVSGIYPCGEGAGYAGGITSAAMDGMKAAEAIAASYAPYNENG